MKKRMLRIGAFCAALALMVGVCWFANGLVENPISKILATKTAEKHLKENYGDKDFVLERVTFSFKDGSYYAYIHSPSSVDSSFSLTIGMNGKLRYDYYENNVLAGWNTANRIRMDYRNAVDAILDSASFPYQCHIGYGDLKIVSSEYKDAPQTPFYAIVKEDLILDGFYDIKELGTKAGELTIYLYDDTVTIERLAQIMLDIKDIFDKSGMGFCVMDCVLTYPKTEDGIKKDERVEVMNFFYSEIYEEGMVERVRASNEAANTYYGEQDAENLKKIPEENK